jgi:hypothetical protein
VLSYRTEIEVPADRYVCLQLPLNLPEGRATVIVYFHGTIPGESLNPDLIDSDHDDIEWWEEFDETRDSLG